MTAEENDGDDKERPARTALMARDSDKGWLLLIPLGILVVGMALLEVSMLDRRPLANDESTSYFIAHIGWSSFWESIRTSEANGSIFYFLLRFWLNVGRSEGVLRVLPMVFAIATVPVLFAATRLLFGWLTALVAATLIATNVMFLEHGQDLRSYSLSALLVTLSSWFFARGVANPSVGNRIGHVAASALALYAHFFSSLVLLAQLLASLLYPDRRRSLRFVGVNMAIVGLLGSPLAAFVLFNDRGQVDWIPELSPKRVREALLELSGMPSKTTMLVLGGVLVAGFALAAWKRPPDPARSASEDSTGAFEARAWRLGFAALWFILPIAGALLISVFKPLFISRYLLVALPGLAISTAVAISSLRQPLAIVAVTAGFVFLASQGISEWRATPLGKWGYSEKVNYVREAAEPGDGFFLYAPTIIRPFGYYAGYYGHGPDSSAIPPPIYPEIDWLGYSATKYRPNLERLEQEVAQHDRVWLLAGFARDKPRVRELRKIRTMLWSECSGGVSDTAFGGDLELYEGCGAR